ncbi:hypothetical protein [Methylobacterium flocculans]|uniref:hypothetical protein n=1 Tax=Methylobacterium flocculans TaxID=2984843 RepID=UPI0021F28182|nr:hypothetical protein [Methylobacterium sp. FF17]
MPGNPAFDTSFTRVLIVELATTTATQCLMSTADPASSTTMNRAEQLFVLADTTLRARRSAAGSPEDASVLHVAGRHIIIEDVIAGTSRATVWVDRANAVTSGTTSPPPVGTTKQPSVLDALPEPTMPTRMPISPEVSSTTVCSR